MFEMLSECDDCDSSEGKERLKLLDSYQTGKINRLFKKGWSRKSYYKDLPQSPQSVQPPKRIRAVSK